MGKKRGRKASYIVYAGEEVKDLIDSKEVGISLHTSTKNYYTMLPCTTGTKKQWLGSDIGMAVCRFKAIVDSLKGKSAKVSIEADKVNLNVKKGKHITVDTDNGQIQGYQIDKNYSIPETVFIEWLKKELLHPKTLAKKTGIEALATITDALAQTTDINLKDLLKKYQSKPEQIDPVEARNCAKAFNDFLDVVECSKLSEITVEDINRYEAYIHKLDISNVSKKNMINKVGTIINYCTKKIDSTKLMQLHKWIQGVNRPKDVKPYNPTTISLDDFNALFEVAELKYKVMLLLSLNCAMYPVDLCRLKISDIDFKQGTVSYRRGKTGKVLAVSTLWTRTKDLLQKYLQERKGKSDFVFITYLGKDFTPKGLSGIFDRTIREKAGVDKAVKLNHLRDTFSTTALDLGYSTDQINLVLGHSRGILDRYAFRNASKLTKEMCEAVETEFFKK